MSTQPGVGTQNQRYLSVLIQYYQVSHGNQKRATWLVRVLAVFALLVMKGKQS